MPTMGELVALLGKKVRMKKGVCGEGYEFVVMEVSKGAPVMGSGWQVSGSNYGPVRVEEVEEV